MRVVICGPPHSGKSVFVQGLVAHLPRYSYYIFRACPDGEGTWTWRSPEAAAFRRKGRFTPEFVDWCCRALRRAREMARVVLVDVGGRMSEENRRIMRECDAAVVLSGDPAQIESWASFCRECGLEVLAKVRSDYAAAEDRLEGEYPVVHRLERGEDVSGRPVIRAVAQMLLEKAGITEERREKMDLVKDGVLSIAGLAEALGKQPVERVEPNGRVVRQVVWRGDDLVEVSRLLHNVSGDLPEHVKVDGPAPGWLVAALVHELHPRAVSLNSPDGYVPVGCQRPAGAGAGPNLVFEVSPGSGGWTVVECRQADPSVPLSPGDLEKVVPPEVPFGAKVVLSGRMPNWLVASLAMAYHGRAKAVACFQPGVGATVAWTHSPDVALGSVIDVVPLRAPGLAGAAVEAAAKAAGQAAGAAARWPVLER